MNGKEKFDNNTKLRKVRNNENKKEKKKRKTNTVCD